VDAPHQQDKNQHADADRNQAANPQRLWIYAWSARGWTATGGPPGAVVNFFVEE
jgi:hypothetical protein